MSTNSISLLELVDESFNEIQTNVFNETIPLELTNVADEAVCRLLSRIQSRRSTDSKLPVLEKSDELNKPKYTKKDLENGTNENTNKRARLSGENKDSKTERFSIKTKKICIFIAAVSGFLSPLSSLAFLPAIPEMAKEYNTTGEIINVSSAVYCVFMSLSPFVFSPFSATVEDFRFWFAPAFSQYALY